MDDSTPRPTLLSAARDFMRKSAGKAALVITPLAAVAFASEAKAQTYFSPPGVFVGTASGGSAPLMGSSFPSGGSNQFFVSGGVFGNIARNRIGANGSFDTLTTSGYGTSAQNTLQFNMSFSGDNVSGGTIIPIAYDFSLSVLNIPGNVNWQLAAQATDNDYSVLASGVLNTSSNTFTGLGNYTLTNTVLGDNTKDLQLFLLFDYTTLGSSDQLFVIMNSGTQGLTVNASAVPEPSTYAAILGLGALGFVVLRRSRRCAA